MGKQKEPTGTGHGRPSHGPSAEPARAAPRAAARIPAAAARVLARRVGDQRAQRILAPPDPAGAAGRGGRAKLAVNVPGDTYEREADRMADAVMRGPPAGVSGRGDGAVLRRCACGGTCASCRGEEETEPLRREADVSGGSPGFAPPIVHDVLASAGRPLEAGTRAFMERGFGVDFGGVRVHTDAQSAASARAVNAHAYTVGSHVAFAAGRYAPGTREGDRLIAHELTHVVQQGGGPAAPMTGEQGRGHGGEAGVARRLAAHLDAAAGAPVLQRTAWPALMRNADFSSTVEICHRLLESRVFTVSSGGLVVALDTRWDGPAAGAASCESHRASPYHVTLVQKGFVFDSEYGTCAFDPQSRSTRAWAGLPSDEYFLRIWTNNTNPHCCLTGTIDVSERAGLTGGSCTQLPDDALTILHTALDVAGLVPGLGAIPDAINSGVYLIEGDWVNAGISAAAMVPIFGEGAALTRLGLRVTRGSVVRVGREGIEQGVRAARQTARVGTGLVRRITEHGLNHSFDRHAAQWFGRTVPRTTHLPQWRALIERAMASRQVFPWTVAGQETVAHLARIEGKNFVVQFFRETGELATAFVPNSAQLREMFRLLREVP